MAKNPNKKVAPKDEPMNGAMKFFLAGCVAELYLLILRRFYINADSELTTTSGLWPGSARVCWQWA